MRAAALLLLTACFEGASRPGLSADAAAARRARTLEGPETVANPLSAALGAEISVGDLDGDGIDDLLVSTTSATGGEVAWIPGRPDGMSADDAMLLTESVTTTGTLGSGLAIADLDGDGAMEAAATWSPTRPNSDDAVLLFAGASGGVEASGSKLEITSDCYDADEAYAPSYHWLRTAGDVDGDGLDELVYHVGTYNDDTEEAIEACSFDALLYGDDVAPGEEVGELDLATKEDERYGGDSETEILGAGDVDGDGYGDLVAAQAGLVYELGGVELFLGASDHEEAQGADQTLVWDDTESMGETVSALGDRDGDGHAEVAITGTAGGRYETVVRIIVGGPEGLDEELFRDLSLSSTISLSNIKLGWGDLDGDGALDLVFPYQSSGVLMAWLPGDDVEADLEAIEAFSSVFRSTDGLPGALGDLDGDSLDDVVVTRGSAASSVAIEVYRGDADPVDEDPTLCWADADGDGVASDETVESEDAACDGPGEAAATGEDCDDADAGVYPGAAEIVGDGVDQDCDGTERCSVDADGDGYRPEGDATIASADLDCDDAGEAASDAEDGDCDDADSRVSPGGVEIAGDGIDQDCDGVDPPAPEDTADPEEASGGCATGGGVSKLGGWAILVFALVFWRRWPCAR